PSVCCSKVSKPSSLTRSEITGSCCGQNHVGPRSNLPKSGLSTSALLKTLPPSRPLASRTLHAMPREISIDAARRPLKPAPTIIIGSFIFLPPIFLCLLRSKLMGYFSIWLYSFTQSYLAMHALHLLILCSSIGFL